MKRRFNKIPIDESVGKVGRFYEGIFQTRWYKTQQPKGWFDAKNLNFDDIVNFNKKLLFSWAIIIII